MNIFTYLKVINRGRKLMKWKDVKLSNYKSKQLLCELGENSMLPMVTKSHTYTRQGDNYESIFIGSADLLQEKLFLGEVVLKSSGNEFEYRIESYVYAKNKYRCDNFKLHNSATSSSGFNIFKAFDSYEGSLDANGLFDDEKGRLFSSDANALIRSIEGRFKDGLLDTSKNVTITYRYLDDINQINGEAFFNEDATISHVKYKNEYLFY